MNILIQKYQRVSSKSFGIGSVLVKRRTGRRRSSVKEDNIERVPDVFIEVPGNQCTLLCEKQDLFVTALSIKY